MKASTIKYGVLTCTLTIISLIFILLPFHAFLTVWASSIFGHYTAFRLWKEVLMALAFLGVLYLLLFDRKVRHHTLRRKLTWLIVAYMVVQIIWGLCVWHSDNVTLKAMLYGVLINCRFLLFFLLGWAIAIRTERFERRWPKLMLWPAVLVVLFGLLQVFALPVDFLRHFGYSAATIAPYETINSNMDFLRYASTLRGANPLGAYLLIPISALVVLLVRFPRSWNWTKGLLLVGALAMLFFSFSRSAWIGAAFSIVFAIAVAMNPAWWRRYRFQFAGAATALLVACVVGIFAFQDNRHFQNFIFHTEDKSTVAVSSNDDRASAIQNGLEDLRDDPLGDGPGTAGPASVYNDEGRISENYYLQVAQETGWLGLGLFLVILSTVAYLLWTRRDATLALSLLAALVGISIVNLMSHAWTDDTLAYIWWGLAGLAIGTPVVKRVVTSESKA
ncbi:MAG TPA: O-antigen ligase family protein [Candidatus Saccharimonadales bacterium]